MREKDNGFKYADALNSFSSLHSARNLGRAFYREIHRISSEQGVDFEKLCKDIALRIDLKGEAAKDKASWVRARFAEALGSK